MELHVPSFVAARALHPAAPRSFIGPRGDGEADTWHKRMTRKEAANLLDYPTCLAHNQERDGEPRAGAGGAPLAC